MSRHLFWALALVFTFACDQRQDVEPDVERRSSCDFQLESESLDTLESSMGVPPGGWGPDDEVGNANLLGAVTTRRCGKILSHPHTKLYEIGHLHSPSMPTSPFAAHPFAVDYEPSAALPFMAHVANEETIHGTLAHQGTQLDALGHFGYMPSPWFPPDPPDFDSALYYNGFTQADVKPTPDSALLKLGAEKIPPIVTSAVILDAKGWFGRALEAGEQITAADVQAMVQADSQLKSRGILPGDAVYVRTGWGEGWGVNPTYYLQGPGLAVDAAEYLAGKGVVVVGLDNPFTDPAQLCGGEFCGWCDDGTSCSVQPGTLPGLPFGIHHHNLAVAGVYQIQNMNLTEIADDGVSVACTMVVPLAIEGGSGSPVRPIAYGR